MFVNVRKCSEMSPTQHCKILWKNETEQLDQHYLNCEVALEDLRLLFIRVNFIFIFQEELDPSLAPILNKSIIKQGN